MIDIETREEFIQLRAEGLSYAKIAERIGVSKQTLMNWNNEYRNEITSLRDGRLDELCSKFLISTEKRVQLFGTTLQSIMDELSKRDLSDVPTPKLFALMTRYAALLKEEVPPPTRPIAPPPTMSDLIDMLQ